MSDDRRGIALQALRAAGHDQAADLVEAIIPAPPAEAPAAPGAPAIPPAEVAATLPEGVMSLAEIEAYEQKGDGRHAGSSHAEQMESADRYIRSAEYHMGRGR
jgi:hypothetical protein